MDPASLIIIIVVIIAIYFFIKLVVSPLLRAVAGVIIFLLVIYILKQFFNFNLDNVLGPFAKYVDIGSWNVDLSWLLDPINNYIFKAQDYSHYLLQNLPKLK